MRSGRENCDLQRQWHQCAPRGAHALARRIRAPRRRPEVRSAYRTLLDQGWVDAVRALHPDERGD